MSSPVLTPVEVPGVGVGVMVSSGVTVGVASGCFWLMMVTSALRLFSSNSTFPFSTVTAYLNPSVPPTRFPSASVSAT